MKKRACVSIPLDDLAMYPLILNARVHTRTWASLQKGRIPALFEHPDLFWCPAVQCDCDNNRKGGGGEEGVRNGEQVCACEMGGGGGKTDVI